MAGGGLGLFPDAAAIKLPLDRICGDPAGAWIDLSPYKIRANALASSSLCAVPIWSGVNPIPGAGPIGKVAPLPYTEAPSRIAPKTPLRSPHDTETATAFRSIQIHFARYHSLKSVV